jgi:DNA-binding IclR family transcriptional regulator
MVAESSRAVRLAAIANSLDAPKASLHGLLKGLLATGYLRESPEGYLLGPAVSILASATESPVGETARTVLEKLRAKFDETVIVSAQVGSSVVYLDMVESYQFIRYTAPLHQRRPIYPTSTGKCFLAHMAVERRDQILSKFIHDPVVLHTVQEELSRAGVEGVAYNHGETVPDVSAAASFARLAGRSPIAVAVVGPTHRVAPRFAQIATAVKNAATELASNASHY